MTNVTLEYVWIDGTKPTKKLRSKTKVVRADTKRFDSIGAYFGTTPRFLTDKDLEIIPTWGFDGSSTNQATGDKSDCVLKPVRLYKDLERKLGYIVLCEVFNSDGTPHETNTRFKLRETYEQYKDQKPMFGIEQEYTLMIGDRPLGFPEGGYPHPQGMYYCGVGADEVFGREIVEEHMQVCLDMGLMFEGINAEVMPGQWEFQIGAGDPLTISDDLWMGRYLLYRIAGKYKVSATLDPKPVRGDWNGSGAHTNFSTELMRKDYNAILEGIKKLETNHTAHIKIYGADNHNRLTGQHETAHIDEFRWGVSDRGASIRIPWHVANKMKGYLEDRRPAANIDPYQVTRIIMKTCCL